MYGAQRLRQYIAHHVALAQHFAERVRRDARLELAAPPRFGLVCFRCGPPARPPPTHRPACLLAFCLRWNALDGNERKRRGTSLRACCACAARRLRDAPREQQVRFLDEINAGGDLFLVHTEVAGRYTLRLAVGSSSTQLSHVEEAWEAVSAAADRVLAAAASTASTAARQEQH